MLFVLSRRRWYNSIRVLNKNEYIGEEILDIFRGSKYYTEEEIKDLGEDTSNFGKKFIDMTGKVFGELEVLKFHYRKNPHSYWFCKCSCGSISSASTNQLNRDKTSCGKCGTKSGGYKRRKSFSEIIKLIKEKHPSIEILRKGKNRGKSVWHFYCPFCATDFSSSLDRMYKDDCACRCEGRYTNCTKIQRERQIKEVAARKGLKFLGWKTDFDSGNNSRFFVKCPSHPHYEINIANFVTTTADYNCPYCADERKGLSCKHTLEKFIEDANRVHNGKFDYSNYVYTCSRTPSYIYCPDCDITFKASYDNHVNKQRGCPAERGRVPIYTYLLSIYDGDVPIGLKYGKANKYEVRIKAHINGNKHYNIETVGVWKYPDINACNHSETTVKRNVKPYHLDKKCFSTGAQETVCVSELENIIKMFEDNKV